MVRAQLKATLLLALLCSQYAVVVLGRANNFIAVPPPFALGHGVLPFVKVVNVDSESGAPQAESGFNVDTRCVYNRWKDIDDSTKHSLNILTIMYTGMLAALAPHKGTFLAASLLTNPKYFAPGFNATTLTADIIRVGESMKVVFAACKLQPPTTAMDPGFQITIHGRHLLQRLSGGGSAAQTDAIGTVAPSSIGNVGPQMEQQMPTATASPTIAVPYQAEDGHVVNQELRHSSDVVLWGALGVAVGVAAVTAGIIAGPVLVPVVTATVVGWGWGVGATAIAAAATEAVTGAVVANEMAALCESYVEAWGDLTESERPDEKEKATYELTKSATELLIDTASGLNYAKDFEGTAAQKAIRAAQGDRSKVISGSTADEEVLEESFKVLDKMRKGAKPNEAFVEPIGDLYTSKGLKSALQVGKSGAAMAIESHDIKETSKSVSKYIKAFGTEGVDPLDGSGPGALERQLSRVAEAVKAKAEKPGLGPWHGLTHPTVTPGCLKVAGTYKLSKPTTSKGCTQLSASTSYLMSLTINADCTYSAILSNGMKETGRYFPSSTDVWTGKLTADQVHTTNQVIPWATAYPGYPATCKVANGKLVDFIRGCIHTSTINGWAKGRVHGAGYKYTVGGQHYMLCDCVTNMPCNVPVESGYGVELVGYHDCVNCGAYPCPTGMKCTNRRPTLSQTPSLSFALCV